MADLCQTLVAARARAENAPTREEFRSRSLELLETQAAFLSQARRISPPTNARSAFQGYLSGIEKLGSLSMQSLQGASSRRRGIAIELAAADAGLETFNAKVSAGLPQECPPGPEREVHRFLFVARGNASCLDLAAEFSQLGRLDFASGTRAETGRLLELAQGLATKLAAELRAAIPHEAEGNQALERAVSLYEERAEAIEDLKRAFEDEDEGEYRAAARREAKAGSAADRLSGSLGMTACLGFLRVQAD